MKHPRTHQEALFTVLDRYINGERLTGLQCSPDIGELLLQVGREQVVNVEIVAKQRDAWTLDITVTIPNTLVGELWQQLHDRTQ